jgi:predicted RNA-binding protein YlxR (DUF448 family)
MCVGCRQTAAQSSLIRLRKSPEGIVVGPGPGRGAYLHPDPGCIEQARKRRGLERALRGQVEEEVWTVLGRIIGSV